MLKTLRTCLLAGTVSIALAACATTGGTGGIPADTISQIQNAAVLACAFLPTATTIAQILAQNSPGLQTATAVATAICAAVAPTTARGLFARGTAVPTVAGVRIEGTFVTVQR